MTSNVVEDINHLFRLRRSGRAFDPARAVSSHDLAALFEAARWAPSAGNLQPWHYVYAHKGEGDSYERLLNLINPHNREWAQLAPLLLLTGALTVRSNAQGELIPNPSAMHDLGMANLSIALEAVARGLMTHMIGGFDKALAADFLPKHVEPLCMIAVGYPGDASLLSAFNQERETAPRARRPVEDFAAKL